MSTYEPIEHRVSLQNRYDRKDVVTHWAEAPNQEASFAMKLIEHFAVVAGNDGGEDSTGRAKLRLQTPEELVARAFEIAERTFTEARARGWTIKFPLPEPTLEQEPETTR